MTQPELFQLAAAAHEHRTTRGVEVRLAEELPVSTTKPDPGLLESVRRVGVLLPVILSWDEAEILDGKRRVAAAQAIDPSTPVRIIVAGKGAAAASVYTLTANWHRSDNVVHEAEAVARLVRLGWSVDQIAAELQTSKPKVQRRLALSRLPEPLWAALREGKLAPSTAAACTSLPLSVQAALGEFVREGNKLTSQKIREFRQAVKLEQAEALPDDLFVGGPDLVQRSVGITVTPETAAFLRSALRAIARRGDVSTFSMDRDRVERALAELGEPTEAVA